MPCHSFKACSVLVQCSGPVCWNSLGELHPSLMHNPTPHTCTPPHPLQYAEEEKVRERQQVQENFRALVQAEEMDFVPNNEKFDCAVCFGEIEAGEGVTLRDCLHQFCK